MNTELAKLRRQMAKLQPGTLTELTERAAPFVAKAVGYAELIRSVMPLRQPKEPVRRELNRPGFPEGHLGCVIPPSL